MLELSLSLCLNGHELHLSDQKKPRFVNISGQNITTKETEYESCIILDSFQG